MKVIAEGGFIRDARCQEALDLLESDFIPGQGLAIEKKYYHYSQNNPYRQSPLRWTDYRLGRANIILIANALVVFKLGGCLKVGWADS